MIKEKLGVSDRETVEQVKENPSYLQYFLGIAEYSNKAPFDASIIIIDKLHKSIKDKAKVKPKTYRNRARKEYLLVAKKRRVTRNERRKAIKKQLY